MIKLTRYTSIEELKGSKHAFQSQKSDSERESDLKDFITLIKNYSVTPDPPNLSNSPNSSSSGK